MCGIVGYWGSEHAQRIEVMARAISHRGPDDQGVWVSTSTPLALGNRRLKVLDMSSDGHQPMVTPDGRLVLTFNGEIYNFRELRQELIARGHEFRSRTDTEVLLHALDEWGVGALGRLNGMFAFALWDESKRSLLLARDRIGIKPLYYAVTDEGIVFGSEITPLLLSGVIQAEIDPLALESYLRLLWIPEPGTLFQGVRKVEPGCFLSWDGVEARSIRYWDLPLPCETEPTISNLEESAQMLRHHLANAVKSQLVSDVPVGAFLSGGIDSTCLVALASEAGVRPLRTYSIGFRSSDRTQEGALDDLFFARLAAKTYGTEHEEIILSPNVVDLLPTMVRHLEDPVADPAAINTYLVSRAAKETSTVLLSGSGGDELFGGYNKYVGTKLGGEYQRLAGPLRQNVVEPFADMLPVSIGSVGLRSIRRAKRFLRHASLSEFERFAGFSCYYDAPELEELLGGSPIGTVDPLMGIHALKEAWDSREAEDLVNRMTYVDLKFYLPGLGLAYMDRASMAASVEVRVPLLDDSVVDFVSRLPGRFKVSGMRTKVLLREAMKGLVPKRILERPKAPFVAPVRSWLRQDLATMMNDCLGPARLLRRGLLDPGVVQRMIREHQLGLEDHSLRLWALLTLEIWLQEFQDRAPEFNRAHRAGMSTPSGILERIT